MTPFTEFGVKFSGVGVDELTHDVLHHAPRGLQAVYTCNVDHLRLLEANPDFARAYSRAWRVTLDSSPIAMYHRLRSGALAPKATGSDLAGPIFEGLDPARHSPFFLVSSTHVKSALSKIMSERGFTGVEERFAIPPFGFENDTAYSSLLVDRISGMCTTHLFMGVGAPKSEVWVDRYATPLGDCYAFCFGSAFDFYVGRVRRAPQAMQEIGLEWLWRLASEPQRLAGRYMKDGAVLIRLVLLDLREPRRTNRQIR